MLNNFSLVTFVEEALIQGDIQGGLSRRLKQLPCGENLALLWASLPFGLVNIGAGWQWTLLAAIAGGMAWRTGLVGWERWR